MLLDELTEQFRIRRIVLRTAGHKRLAVAGKLLGVDGEQHQELVLEQRVDECSAGLFETDRDRPAAKPRAEIGRPSLEVVRLLGQIGGHALPAGCEANGDAELARKKNRTRGRSLPQASSAPGSRIAAPPPLAETCGSGATIRANALGVVQRVRCPSANGAK